MWTLNLRRNSYDAIHCIFIAHIVSCKSLGILIILFLIAHWRRNLTANKVLHVVRLPLQLSLALHAHIKLEKNQHVIAIKFDIYGIKGFDRLLLNCLPFFSNKFSRNHNKLSLNIACLNLFHRLIKSSDNNVLKKGVNEGSKKKL